MTVTSVPLKPPRTSAPREPVERGQAAEDMPDRPSPLGPDSLTWKYFGDLRTGMMGVWIGAIQNMYPELGAGVEEHSILLREPLQRVARSVYPIMGVVYDGNRAAQTGAQIKHYHRTIKGVDATGRRYHALNPETFYWAHATFFMLVIKVAEYFCGGLTEAEKRQLFDEHVQWYRMYGMSMRPVPTSWEDFQEYWQRVCRDELEINQATLDIFQIRIPKPKFVMMPTPVWDQLFKALVAGQRPACVGRRAMKWCCDCSASWWSWRFWRFPTRSGCIRVRWRLTAAPTAEPPPMHRWSRRQASWRRHQTAAASRCITSRPALPCPGASSSVPVRWCTPRSR